MTDVLAICTRDRATDLTSCLHALQRCHDLPQTVLVVDSSRDEASAEVVAGIELPAGCTLTYIRSAPGLTRQRNVALDACAASDEVIFFVDDDCHPLPGYFDALREVYDAHPDCAGVGSEVIKCDRAGAWRPVQRTNGTRLRRSVRETIERVSGKAAPDGELSESGFNGALTRRGQRYSPVGVQWLSGCAMSFRTSLATKVRFNETHFTGYGLGEDVEFCLRIGRYGALLLSPDTVMPHAASPVNRLDPRTLARMQVLNTRYLVEHHPDRFSIAAFRRSLVGLAAIHTGLGSWHGVAGVLDGIRAGRVAGNDS